MRRRLAGYLVPVAALVLTGLIGLAGPAFGQSEQKYKQQIREYSKQLDELAKKDEWGVSDRDRERARAWLADAKEVLAQGNVETAKLLVKQVGDTVELVERLVKAKRIEALADEKQKSFERDKSKEIPKLEQEVKELREKNQELKSKLQELQ